MVHPSLIKIIDKLPKCNSIFIAGGAAIEFGYHAATDVDVWIGAKRYDLALQFLQSLDWYWLQPFPKDYKTGKVDSVSVGIGYLAGIVKPIQVLVHDQLDCKAVLEDFDLSCCQWAISSKTAERVGVETSTTDGQPIRVVKAFETDTVNVSVARYLKYCNRLNQQPDPIYMSTVFKQDQSLCANSGVFATAPKHTPFYEEAQDASAAAFKSLSQALKELKLYNPDFPLKYISWDAETPVQSPQIQAPFIYGSSLGGKESAPAEKPLIKKLYSPKE